MNSQLAVLLLADGRFPTGGHAHSAGVEAAVADGRLRDETDLEAWLSGRVAATGRVDASLAAMTVVRLTGAPSDAAVIEVLRALDAEGAARLPAHPIREASRRLGRRRDSVSTAINNDRFPKLRAEIEAIISK